MPLLAKTPSPSRAPTPAVALHDPEPARRRQAIRAIAPQVGAAALLAERLGCEQEASVRHVLLGALADHPDETSEVALAECLRSVDAALRNGAIDALRSNPQRRRRIAETLLDDPDADVRISALTLLDDAAATGTVDRMVTLARLHVMLETEANVNVCGAALGLLETIATHDTLPVLRRLACRFADEPYIQFAYARVIERLATGATR